MSVSFNKTYDDALMVVVVVVLVVLQWALVLLLSYLWASLVETVLTKERNSLSSHKTCCVKCVSVVKATPNPIHDNDDDNDDDDNDVCTWICLIEIC